MPKPPPRGAPLDLNLVRAFVEVTRAGSFVGAAERLGVPRSTVSRAIAALEAALGCVVFHRTTRKVTPSTDGAALYDQVAPAYLALEASLRARPAREEQPTGTLRITSTADLGATVLAEAAARFTARYPAVQIETHLTNTTIDLLRDGFDMALRISGKRLRDSSLVARRVGAIELRLYAAPAYLARRGTPRGPDDLRDHDGVGFRGSWALTLTSAGARAPLELRPRVLGDDTNFMRECLKHGGGIGALPSFQADPEVASGALVPVLPRWLGHVGGVFLVYPGRKPLPPKITAFRDLVAELLRRRPLTAAS